MQLFPCTDAGVYPGRCVFGCVHQVPRTVRHAYVRVSVCQPEGEFHEGGEGKGWRGHHENEGQAWRPQEGWQ